MANIDWLTLVEFGTPKQKQYAEALAKGWTQQQTAEHFGVNIRTLERALQKLKAKVKNKQGYAPEYGLIHPAPPGWSAKRVSTMFRTEDGLPQWARFEPDATTESSHALQEFMDAFCEPYKGKSKPVKSPKTSNENLLSLYCLGDLHYGMRAWKQETGSENFDTDIAEADLTSALTHLVSMVPDSSVGVLLNLGDAFHADGLKDVTPESGHLLDTDGRMSHTIQALARTFRRAVDLMLAKHNEVWMINVRGNHDPSASLFFNHIMKAYYENEPRVKVFDNECKFINFVWGKCLIATHHTDKINFQRWYEALTRDYAEMWGQTKYRYGHGGHVHHEQVKEIGGMIFHTWQTLAAPDAWHAASGYGSGRSSTAVTYDKEYGEVSRVKCGIQLARSYLTQA